MAWDKIRYVLKYSKAKTSHQLVLLRIANHSNDEGLAWPSYQTLANETGYTRRYVIRIVADLEAVGEIEILPTGSPYGGQAYRIPGGTISSPDEIASELSSPRIKSSGEKKDTQLVNSVHPNPNTKPIYCKNVTNDKDEWLTREQAVKLGLTPGSRMYRQATGELLPGET
jgi:hypothetical protein